MWDLKLVHLDRQGSHPLAVFVCGVMSFGFSELWNFFRSGFRKFGRADEDRRYVVADTISEKLCGWKTELAPAASATQVAEAERKLGVLLPCLLKEFLLEHNGTAKHSPEWMWYFWPIEEMASFSEYRGKESFVPELTWLPETLQKGGELRLDGSKLICFADVLIEAPLYGVFLEPGHRCYGMVFDVDFGTLSSFSFEEWVAMFLERGEDVVLLDSES